jgi:hypothetical protein
MKIQKSTMTNKFTNSVNKNRRSSRKNLNDFTRMQNTLDNHDKKLILDEEKEIKNYGAIYVSQDGKTFHLTNDSNYKNGNKVAEMTFHKVLFQKG